MKNTGAGSFEMHVLGSCIGESIILRLPNNRWGVVDCYSRSTTTGGNPTLTFLQERNVGTLEFLCLTHPHHDHYRGMSELLRELTVNSFWRPGAMTGSRLRQVLADSRIGTRRSGLRDHVENGDELAEIFRLVKTQQKARKDPLTIKNGTLGTLLYPVPVDSTAKFQIWAIGPSTKQVDRYESQLRKSFDSDGRLIDRVPYASHNIASMGLLILFGSTRVVLGGDIEKAGWEDILKEYGRQHLPSTAVKVSHHGSDTGFTGDLWRELTSGVMTTAIITPFRRYRLPRQSAVDHIRSHAARVLSPCVTAVDDRRSSIPFGIAPPRSRKTLAEKMNARTQSNSWPVGCCSLFLDDAGNITKERFTAPGGVLSTGHSD